MRSSCQRTLLIGQASRAGNRDAFLTKIDPSLSGGASLRYSTFLGGDEEESGTGVAVDGEGRVYLTGYTRSDDFPLASPLQAARSGGTCSGDPCSDLFVTKLDLVSNTLLYSTYLGGTGDDEGSAIVLDETNQAFIAGFTYSVDFPLADPFQAQKGSEGCSAPPCTDAFVLALNPSGGALLYSSYLGGSKDDYGYDLALDNQGEAYLTGETYSTDFPTTPGAYDVTLEGTKRDAFVVKVSQPTTQEQQTQVIHYTYDPLNRLTAADYDDGTYFHYSYDAVGNRLSETTQLGTTTYSYDVANRLTSVNGVSYTWDNNGNLLNDGTNIYTYNHANRLTSVSSPSSAVSFGYNGQGDRIRETVNSVTTSYTLDLAAGLTQVLGDGTNSYLYGNGRIAQYGAGDAEYFLGDALDSVRQLADVNGAATFMQGYEPYGEVLSTAGDEVTNYAFTGEWQDAGTGLIYLRARWYAPWQGRFTSRDTWVGSETRPLSYNRWVYGYANPLKYLDPSGYYPCSNCNYVPYGWPRKMCLEFCCRENEESLDSDAAYMSTPWIGPDTDPTTGARGSAAYAKYLEVLEKSGKEYLTMKEILATSAFNEFGVTSGQDYKYSEEALGRQLFHFCGYFGYCVDDKLWQFLGSLEGWYNKSAESLISGTSDPRGNTTANRIFTESSWKSGSEWRSPFVFGNTTMYPNAEQRILNADVGSEKNMNFVLVVDLKYIVWSPEQRVYWKKVEAGGFPP